MMRWSLPAWLIHLGCAAVLCAVPALAQESTPEPFEADYRATFMGLQAAARMSLSADDGGDQVRWTYQLDITGAGARLVQSTTFDMDGGHWRPLQSLDSQQGESGLGAMLVKPRTVESVWDWERLEARWSGDIAPERSAPVPLQPGDLDAMLLNLVLVRDVLARQPLTYRLVDDGRAREQRFQRVGTEEINLGGQTHRAFKVRREDGSRAITAWVVDGIPIPVRILQQRRGKDHIDLRLSRWSSAP